MSTKRRGRPPKPPEQAKACPTMVRLDPFRDATLQLHADRLGIPKATLAARLLCEWMDAQSERERKNGEMRTERVAQREGEARAVELARTRTPVAPGVAAAGVRLAKATTNIQLLKTHQPEPLEQGTRHLIVTRK